MKHWFFAPCSHTNADLSGYGKGEIGRGKLEFVGEMGKFVISKVIYPIYDNRSICPIRIKTSNRKITKKIILSLSYSS